MKTIRIVLLVGAFFFFLVGCRTRNQRKSRFEGWDGGAPAVTMECLVPTNSCFDSCKKREAGINCIGCCRDQQLLCDIKKPYSFESCETAH